MDKKDQRSGSASKSNTDRPNMIDESDIENKANFYQNQT